MIGIKLNRREFFIIKTEEMIVNLTDAVTLILCMVYTPQSREPVCICMQ